MKTYHIEVATPLGTSIVGGFDSKEAAKAHARAIRRNKRGIKKSVRIVFA